MELTAKQKKQVKALCKQHQSWTYMGWKAQVSSDSGVVAVFRDKEQNPLPEHRTQGGSTCVK